MSAVSNSVIPPSSARSTIRRHSATSGLPHDPNIIVPSASTETSMPLGPSRRVARRRSHQPGLLLEHQAVPVVDTAGDQPVAHVEAHHPAHRHRTRRRPPRATCTRPPRAGRRRRRRHPRPRSAAPASTPGTRARAHAYSARPTHPLPRAAVCSLTKSSVTWARRHLPNDAITGHSADRRTDGTDRDRPESLGRRVADQRPATERTRQPHTSWAFAYTPWLWLNSIMLPSGSVSAQM